ncbi:MAG: CocE/NonD family hydrolase [Chitinophagaceae bacterium]
MRTRRIQVNRRNNSSIKKSCFVRFGGHAIPALRLFLFILCVAAITLSAPAQAPDAKTYSPEQYKVKQERGYRVAMRDGIHLSADIYKPDQPGRYATLLSILPYDNNGGWKERAKWFAARGYAVMVVDSRGRYDSEGEWDPFDPRHKSDGYDLVEWGAKQPWSSGMVGMYGPSYMGWETWWTATQAPPSLKAIVPEVAPPDAFNNCPYQDGVIHGVFVDWASSNTRRTAQGVATGPYGGFTNTSAGDFLHTPYSDLLRFRGEMDAPWFETWMKENKSTSPYWKAIAYQTKESYSRVNVPSLAVSGWFDANHPGTPMNYLAMKQYGATPDARRPRLVIGPWTHWPVATQTLAGIDYGPDAVIDWNGYVTRFFDHYLKGIDNGVENDLPVHVFVMGRNKWRAEKDWPLPQTQFTKYYLHSQGKANSLKGDGVLSRAKAGPEKADSYVYDPAHPTRDPFIDYPKHNGHIDGGLDTRQEASGADVLVYSTLPLNEEVEVVGPITATLFAATSASDTDWMMRLLDVRPDGSTILLTEGVMRARNRDPENAGRFNAEKISTIEPNRVYEYSLTFVRGTGNLFQKGHQIRIEISSSYFPYYLPNLNSGDENAGLATRKVVATQHIYHDREHSSYITLPVIPQKLYSR